MQKIITTIYGRRRWGLVLLLAIVILPTWWWVQQSRLTDEVWGIPDPESGLRIPIFVLHRVYPGEASEYIISPERLRILVQSLQELKYTPITLQDLDRAIHHGGPLPRHPAMLTFDDTYLDNYTYAFPILLEEGWPAVFFTPAGKVRSPPDDRVAWGEGPEPYVMFWDELREMQAAGMEIASHGLTHINLARTDPETLEFELLESRRLIEKELGELPFAIAYPGGRQSQQVREAAAAAGYTIGFLSGGRSIHFPPENPLALPRVHVAGYIDPAALVRGTTHQIRNPSP